MSQGAQRLCTGPHSCSTSNLDLQSPPNEIRRSTDLHFTKMILSIPLEACRHPGSLQWQNAPYESACPPTSVHCVQLYCDVSFAFNELICGRQTFQINHNFYNAVRVRLFIFSSQGAFKTRGHPSLPRSLRGPEAASHSPLPPWGQRVPWRTPPRTRKGPPSAQEGSSRGIVTVTEKVILNPVRV